MAKPEISVIDRRLQGEVLDQGSPPIPLKEPKKWRLRWFNAGLRADRIWHALNVLGWTYVLADEVRCPVDQIGAELRDGRIVRGERGQEVLMKMPQEKYRALEQRKARETERVTFHKEAVDSEILTAAGQTHGDQAANFLKTHQMTVKDSKERVVVED